VIAIALVLAAVFVPVGVSRRIDRTALQAVRADARGCRVILSAICALTFTPAMCAPAAAARGARPRAGTGLLARFFTRFQSRLRGARAQRLSRFRLSHAAPHRPRAADLRLAAAGDLGIDRDAGPPVSCRPKTRGSRSRWSPCRMGRRWSEPMRPCRSSRASRARSPAWMAWSTSAASNLLTGQSVSYNATAFIRLKPWDERRASSESIASLVAHADRTAQWPDQGRQRARAQPAADSGPRREWRFHFRAAEPRPAPTRRACRKSCRSCSPKRRASARRSAFVYSGFRSPHSTD